MLKNNFRLNRKTIKEIEKARRNIKKGEFVTEEEAEKILRFNRGYIHTR